LVTTASAQLDLWVEDRVVPAVVVIAGSLVGEAAPALRQVMCRLTGCERPDILVDLSKVDFVDPVGIGVLAAAHCRAKRNGGRVIALSTRPAVSWAMRVAGLGAMIWEGSCPPGASPVPHSSIAISDGAGSRDHNPRESSVG
jgi:anti-anti-sigma factor